MYTILKTKVHMTFAMCKRFPAFLVMWRFTTKCLLFDNFGPRAFSSSRLKCRRDQNNPELTGTSAVHVTALYPVETLRCTLTSVDQMNRCS